MKRHRTSNDSLNYQDPFGNTLLHGAAVSGDLQEVERLLAAGADPMIANRDGRTALHAAAILGHRQVYDLLAEWPRSRARRESLSSST
jgi:ankyrin repeat protein